MIKKVAVGGAAPKGGIVMFETETGCPTSLKTCSYEATPATLFPLTSLTVTLKDGTDKVLTSVSAATDQATLGALLKTEMLALGYAFSEAFQDNLPASVTVSGQKLTIVSELVFKSMVASSGSPNFTAKCTQKGSCVFTKSTGSLTSPVKITVNGVERSNANAWTYGTTSTATVKGYIDAALAAEITAGTIVSTAVADTGTQYKVTIVALTGTSILLNGGSFIQSDCAPYFTA
ncbi:MAG: hypothetical protein ABI851_12205 [Saprospiraceae bacterium]